MYKLVFAQREVIHYSKSPNANFLDLVFIKWCVEVINDIKNKFCSISTKQDNFSRFDSFLSKLPISCTILATLSQSRGPGGFKFSVFDYFIRKCMFFCVIPCFKSENFYIWKQNMHFWHFRAPILITIPGPPLPWKPSTKVSNWSSWNCSS